MLARKTFYKIIWDFYYLLLIPFEKKTLIAKQNVIVAHIYSSKNMKITEASDNVKTLKLVPGYQDTFSKTTINIIDNKRNVNVFMNHAVQCNQFGRPIIFIASYNQN